MNINFLDGFNFLNGPEYGTSSWQRGVEVLALFAMVALFAVAITYLIAYIDQTITFTKWNLAIANSRFSAIMYAIIGKTYAQVLREQVISVKRRTDKNFDLSASDREATRRYLVVPVDTDMDDEWYREAKELAGDNAELFEALKPKRGRVRSRSTIVNEESGEEVEMLLTYFSGKPSTIEVEHTVNEFFRSEYKDRMREARAEMRSWKCNYIYVGEVV